MRRLTGVCVGCDLRGPTDIYADDWTTRIEYYEWCLRCAVESSGEPWEDYVARMLQGQTVLDDNVDALKFDDPEPADV